MMFNKLAGDKGVFPSIFERQTHRRLDNLRYGFYY
jgi:hypothetical protein